MGFFGKLTGLDEMRAELRKRITEVLQSGNEWNKTANRLADALERLHKDISEGKAVNLGSNPELKKLEKGCRRLATAFEDTTTTLSKISNKL